LTQYNYEQANSNHGRRLVINIVEAILGGGKCGKNWKMQGRSQFRGAPGLSSHWTPVAMPI